MENRKGSAAWYKEMAGKIEFHRMMWNFYPSLWTRSVTPGYLPPSRVNEFELKVKDRFSISLVVQLGVKEYWFGKKIKTTSDGK